MKTFRLTKKIDEETLEIHSFKRDSNGYYIMSDAESELLTLMKSPIIKYANRVCYILENTINGRFSKEIFNTLYEAKSFLKGALNEDDWEILPLEANGFY